MCWAAVVAPQASASSCQQAAETQRKNGALPPAPAACLLSAGTKGGWALADMEKTWRNQERFPRTSFQRSGFVGLVLRRGFPSRWVRLHTLRQSFDPSVMGFPICPPPLSTSCLQAPPLSSTCVTVLSRSRNQAKTSSKVRHQRDDRKLRSV